MGGKTGHGGEAHLPCHRQCTGSVSSAAAVSAAPATSVSLSPAPASASAPAAAGTAASPATRHITTERF